MSQEDQIIEAMKNAGKPLKNAEIAQLTGIDSKAITKLMKSLKDNGKITSPKRCYYQPV